MSFARDQLVDARYIKERHDGAFVTDQGVRIDDYHYEGGILRRRAVIRSITKEEEEEQEIDQFQLQRTGRGW